MLRVLVVLSVLLLAGCSYTTKAPSGNRYAVIQQPSLTSAPGVTHVERQEVGGAWTYIGTFSGGTTLGEVAGAAGLGLALGLADDGGTNVSASSESSSAAESSSASTSRGWVPPGQQKPRPHRPHHRRPR